LSYWPTWGARRERSPSKTGHSGVRKNEF